MVLEASNSAVAFDASGLPYPIERLVHSALYPREYNLSCDAFNARHGCMYNICTLMICLVPFAY